jgi:hypothetical protein
VVLTPKGKYRGMNGASSPAYLVNDTIKAPESQIKDMEMYPSKKWKKSLAVSMPSNYARKDI